MIIFFIFNIVLIKLDLIGDMCVYLLLNYFLFCLLFSLQSSRKNLINKSINLFFILISSIWILSTNSLFSLWLGIECQSFCIIMVFLGLRPIYLLKIESLINYLFVMTFSGIIFVISLYYYFLGSNEEAELLPFLFTNDKLFIYFLTLSYCCKLGFFPFFFWVKNFFEGLTMIENFIYTGVPKLTMLIVMLKLNLKNELFFLLSYITIFIGAVQGLNQSNLKSILAYSSLSNLGMLAIFFVNSVSDDLACSFIYYYIFLNLGILSCLVYGNWVYIAELPKNYSNQKFISLLILFFLLNLMGLPPFNIFLFKLCVLYNLIFNFSDLFITVALTIPISLTTFYYLRIIVNFMYSNSNNYFFFRNLLTKKKKQKNISLELISINFVLVFSILAIYYLC